MKVTINSGKRRKSLLSALYATGWPRERYWLQINVEFDPYELQVIKEHNMQNELVLSWDEKISGGYVPRGRNISALLKGGSACYVELDDEAKAILFEKELRTQTFPRLKNLIEAYAASKVGKTQTLHY